MNEKNIFIVRVGEVALKGQNKPYFEKTLVRRLERVLQVFEGREVYRKEGLIFVKTPKQWPADQVIETIGKVFGITSISPAVEVESNKEALEQGAVDFVRSLLKNQTVETFKVEARRADKEFPHTSPEIGRFVGGAVLKGLKTLRVDVHDPDLHLFVNVRKDVSYIYEKKIKGFGGLPLGTNGKGLTLLSGGIDSPVAAFLMAKRGMAPEAVHFHSYPYTSERAQEKVERLAQRLAVFCGDFKLHVVNVLPIQEAIMAHCPQDEMTVLLRRFMVKIGEKIAEQCHCDMLITGESLGQVASQTAQALVVTNEGINMPIMRPLIAMDKTEIMDLAQDIDTFETSIEPYEDCCTVFLPKHPVTKPKLEKIQQSEALLDKEKLVAEAVESRETKVIRP